MNLISLYLSIISIEIIFSQIHIRIYDNIAEITRTISPYDLPIIFSQQEWFDIRSDSIRLIGNCLNIHAQIISFNQTSLNGEKILIKRNINNDTYTNGIMIDEKRNLIQDLIDNTYYILTDDRIRYFTIPYQRNYLVDFVLETLPNEQIYLRYLQTNIKWKVRYDLLLDNNDTNTILQAYADIRNNGNSLLIIDFAELISGDINLQSSNSVNGIDGSNYLTQGSTSPSISNPEELVGVYIFTINETFILDPQSNYILPIFRPIINIERYGLIEKYFSSMDNSGNAQRAYRIRVEDTYLPQGQVFIRESDRLIGEISWPDLAANETNEFNLGEDIDLQYFEYIQLNSRREIYPNITIHFFLSTYTIQLYLINMKSRLINFEYRLKFYSQNNLQLKLNSTNNYFQLDGSSIFGTFQINANDEQEFQFTFETE
jgi:hypothetical protein